MLYCLSPKERISWGGVVRERPSQFLQDMDETLYNNEPHVWDEEMRLMLAKTIGKSYGVGDNNGISNKRSSDTEKSDSKKLRYE